ncbi:hypothetical protein Aple_042680 [Acrocarpospora pleiomorpha]|uniref:Uncharacterized protein n=1 Tax=Acrocarpospora pleiomorpha TaxID=90975 RepID=A0A5M3XKH9_9ACTN|nr:hypothetical protein [Acrocarpospora pleiomorpha]GES21372.1 hypothetical protein Aple_042680 [Acrocarpospora pleiomorpha]
MGVPWGIVEYPAKYDRDEVIADWRPFAMSVFALNSRRTFNVMHGEDRVGFRAVRSADGRIELVTSVEQHPLARKRIDALECGDGTYDMFDQLFDGYEVFVPWSTIPATITTPARSWRAWPLRYLEGSMRGHLPEIEDPELQTLARQLLRASVVAAKFNMLVTVSY